jgi:hypothetical protein
MEPPKNLVEIIRESIRDTIHHTLRAVVEEATERELRSALQEEEIRGLLVEVMREELKAALEDLRGRGNQGGRHRRGIRPPKSRGGRNR